MSELIDNRDKTCRNFSKKLKENEKKDKTEIDSLMLPRKISRDGWMQRRYHEMKNGNLRPPDDRNIFWLKAIVDPSMLD